MNANDWAERGVTFVKDEVARRAGPNATDRRTVGDATIAVISDLDKFRAAYGDEYLLHMSNGTSLRVTCQRMWRDNVKMAESEFFLRLDGVFRRVRVAGTSGKTTVIEVTRHDLPDGTAYEGTDEIEYRQLYVMQMVDLGVEVSVAQGIAAKKGW